MFDVISLILESNVSDLMLDKLVRLSSIYSALLNFLVNSQQSCERVKMIWTFFTWKISNRQLSKLNVKWSKFSFFTSSVRCCIKISFFVFIVNSGRGSDRGGVQGDKRAEISSYSPIYCLWNYNQCRVSRAPSTREDVKRGNFGRWIQSVRKLLENDGKFQVQSVASGSENNFIWSRISHIKYDFQ